MRPLKPLIAVLLVLSSLLGVNAAHQASPQAPRLRLQRGTFDARSLGVATSSPGLTAAAVDSYAIIQFRGPITTGDRAALEQTGVNVLEYLPDYAYLVR